MTELFEALFESLPEPLAVVSADGLVLAVNRSFELTTGTQRSNCCEKLLNTLCQLANQEEAPLTLLPHTDSKVLWRGDDLSLKALTLSLRALGTDSGSGHLLLSATPTSLLEGDQSVSAGIQQRKLESLGVLASSVAHDLNNLLTGVLGHVSYLRLSEPQNAENRDSIVAIEDGARRAASLTQQILDFARGGEVELVSVNLTLVVAAGINLLRAAVPENIKIEFFGGKKDISVYGDESQLSQVIMNLLVNACDALPDGGTIRISIDPFALSDDDDLELQPGDYVKLTIRDNGSGIPQEVQGKIFEPFFTTKNERGTGLGLATVYSIVAAYGGAILLESEEGRGTTFDIVLPVCTKEEHLTPASKDTTPAKQQEEIPAGTEKILVVDDEEAVRIVLQRSLELIGYTVLAASGGLEALEIFEEEGANISLVVLDMIMPEMPGDELFYELQKLRKDVRVLIASGYSNDARTKAILRDGALGFIQKPFAVEELATEVRKCLDE